MDILADENVDAPIVAWLRGEGHDVVWMLETAPGKDDAEVLELAMAQQRVIITLDHDFGDLVFRQGMRPSGVILLRLRARSASGLLGAFQELWPVLERRGVGHFVVVSARKVRIRPLSSGDSL